jgi:hypothetical protein
MKKRVFLLLLTSLIFSSLSVNAQSGLFKKHQSVCAYVYGDAQSRHFKKPQPKLGAGVKAGLNYSSQYTNSTTNSVDFKSIIGINAGGYCNFFLLDFLAIQPELMVSGKGSQWKNQYSEAKDNLTYIDLPILIKYQPVELINIHAGPQLSYLVSAKQEDSGNNQKTNVIDYYYKFDFGFAFGVEANLPYNVNLTIRYILGLNTATTRAVYTEIWKNKSFQISLGYRILGR